MLSEKLLQFIWQFQYFQKQNLVTTSGDSLDICQPGLFNTNQGPDFLQAKIKINQTVWAGNIEIHIDSADWFLHQHETDEAYNNVILHVVWKQSKPVTDASGKPIPTLVLEPLVSKIMLQQYEKLMQSQSWIPCENSLPVLSQLGWQNWLERMLVERLQKRAALLLQKLEANGNHWEDLFWQTLARNFGMPVNADAFENLAQSIPVQILAKQKHNIHQLEALLLGQAGLLCEEATDDYVLLLQREYAFLKHKFSFKKASVKPVFLRMRPASFPTVRLAQLAMLIFQSEHLFSKLLEAKNAAEALSFLNVTANDFWHYHYQLDVTTDYKPKALGTQMAENILINTLVPMLFAYGLYHQKQAYKDKAIDWLSQIKPEQNKVIAGWKKLGVKSENALQSQGLLELKKWYCDEHKCLQCAIGNKILKSSV